MASKQPAMTDFLPAVKRRRVLKGANAARPRGELLVGSSNSPFSNLGDPSPQSEKDELDLSNAGAQDEAFSGPRPAQKRRAKTEEPAVRKRVSWQLEEQPRSIEDMKTLRRSLVYEEASAPTAAASSSPSLLSPPNPRNLQGRLESAKDEVEGEQKGIGEGSDGSHGRKLSSEGGSHGRTFSWHRAQVTSEDSHRFKSRGARMAAAAAVNIPMLESPSTLDEKGEESSRKEKEERVDLIYTKEKLGTPTSSKRSFVESEGIAGDSGRRVKRQASNEVPQSYMHLEILYGAVEMACALLRSRRQLTTFESICKPVEEMTGRRFLRQHLAQLKAIYPEILQLEPVLTRDATSADCSSHWELRVELTTPLNGPKGSGKGNSGDGLSSGRGRDEGLMLKRKAEFRSRLLEMAATIPEADDIPQAALPIAPPITSHCFLASPPKTPAPYLCSPSKSAMTSASPSSGSRAKKGEAPASPNHKPIPNSASPFRATRRKLNLDFVDALPTSASEGKAQTLGGVKPRCLFTCEEETSISCAGRQGNGAEKEGGEIGRKVHGERFSSVQGSHESASTLVDGDDSDAKILRSLPKDLLQSVQRSEVRIAHENSAAVQSQRIRRKRVAGLPYLLDMIRTTFLGLGKAVMSHHELVQRLLATHTKLTDRDEVEAQLDLLLELAPDLILVKPSLKGDLLYRLQGGANAVSIRKRLVSTVKAGLG